ncbi:LysM domain protein [Stachybotrys elegans]|uniref:LysM domain protein n=1 Tax=Stachybotrys elegans TaxID=80388 RepID=A0A8K0SU26_9HYPO|nr:LysM domain protein [Stachybotrys elegans]
MLLQLSLVLLVAGVQLGHCLVVGRASNQTRLLADEPAYPYDPDTSPYCSWWMDHVGGLYCPDVPLGWQISVQDFLRWNPSLGPVCEGLLPAETSYCVETTGEPEEPTPTDPGNGIETPLPYQPGMIGNCDKFYLVPEGGGCQSIADANGISLAEFITWNPKVGSTCGGLWADVYVCVSVMGHEPKPTTTASPTTPPNGITTPVPTQPEIVGNCDKFHLVEQDESCASIARAYGISQSQFLTWNPKAGNTCSGLWADAYACVSIIGHEPTPTSPGNGVATPSPIQNGMTPNCKTFHFVQADETCRTISARYGITVANFVAWNPAVGSTCAGLWGSTYACVAVL